VYTDTALHPTRPGAAFFKLIVIGKYFYINSEKNLAKIRAVVYEKNVKSALIRHTPIRKNDVTKPKATLITSKGYFQQPFANKMVQK